MTQISLDIERVVREVIAELQHAPMMEVSKPVLPSSEPSSSSSSGTSTIVTMSQPGAKMPTSSPSGNGQLVLSARLVTMADIDSRLKGIRQVVVNPQAVVTPAVCDALRLRNITLSRALPAKNISVSSLKLIVVAARTKMDPKSLANTLKNEGVNVECRSTDCILDATDRLTVALAKGDTLGLLLTPHTAAAMCLANRLSVVRAVLGGNTSNIEADLNAVGANLLIIDPKNISLFKLCRIAGEYYRGGMRTCPEVFRKRLM
jgi:hypothetical protein